MLAAQPTGGAPLAHLSAPTTISAIMPESSMMVPSPEDMFSAAYSLEAGQGHMMGGQHGMGSGFANATDNENGGLHGVNMMSHGRYDTRGNGRSVQSGRFKEMSPGNLQPSVPI